MSTRFLRDRPWHFAHVINVSPPSLLRMGFSFLFLSLETWDPLRPKYREKKCRKKKKEKTPFVKGSAGEHVKHVCKISESKSRKRRGHWTLKELNSWATEYERTPNSLFNNKQKIIFQRFPPSNNLLLYAWTSLYVLRVRIYIIFYFFVFLV